MALTDRYFSTSSAGAADGTTWNDRAALFSAGNWSTVLTGFDFGANGMRAIVGPGSYTCSQQLSSGVFTTASPATSTPLIFHGADSSGNLLDPPDPNWTSDIGAWDDSSLPVIASTTNIITITQASTLMRLMKFTASGRNGALISTNAGIEWCVITNTTANTAAIALLTGGTPVFNSVLSCTGSSYSTVWQDGTSYFGHNNRIVGVTGSSGNRDGIAGAGGTSTMDFMTVISNGGRGIAYTGTSTTVNWRLMNCLIANNGGDGIQFPNTALQTGRNYLHHLMVTGNGGYGLNPGGTNTYFVVSDCRARDNTSGNTNITNNYPLSSLYTTDSDDATEYVNSGSGNYQIKSGATIHGRGYGVSEQASSGSGGGYVIGA